MCIVCNWLKKLFSCKCSPDGQCSCGKKEEATPAVPVAPVAPVSPESAEPEKEENK